jgi:hypothetical protein
MILTVVIIVVIIIIIYLICFVKKTDLHQYRPIYNYAHIKDKLKTGDIVVFSCKKYNTLFCRLEYYFRTNFIGTEFGHSGIVLKLKDELYFVECTDKKYLCDKYAYKLNNFGKGGIRIVNFEKIIRQYQKDYNATFAVKFISKEIPFRTIFKVLDDYKKIKFSKKSIAVLMFIIDMCISHQIARKFFVDWYINKMICSQFVCDILNKCNVLACYPPYLFWPPMIMDGTLDRISIVKYSEPYKFIITDEL